MTETSYAEKLLALAQNETADLFIVLLNNMRCSDVRISSIGIALSLCQQSSPT